MYLNEIRLKNNNQRTPLTVACAVGNLEIINFFITMVLKKIYL